MKKRIAKIWLWIAATFLMSAIGYAIYINLPGSLVPIVAITIFTLTAWSINEVTKK